MKLIVGLGNPGREYKKTRHNIGFMILDEYLGDVEYKKNFDSFIYIQNDVIFIKPQSYMNLSGIAVRKVVDFYKIDSKDILIIQDDLDIELGSYKLKRNSSSGGHNGIKSIISELNTQEFARLKIGIGKDKNIPAEKYVLAKFKKEEIRIIESNKDIYFNIIDNFINNKIDNE